MTQRLPLPITNAMLLPANANFDKPRYTGAGVATDWHGGDVGHDVDIAEATQAVANSHSANVETDYDPQHQEGKGKKMNPIRTPLSDLGKDYGIYNTSQYRSGTIDPRTPYPDANSPPAVTGVSPSTGLAAGGTSVTISGTGFTGATGVTFGGTAATAVVVVSPNIITATSPAKAAGTYDVRVTTPKGTSAIGGLADNFIYT
jgi:IPT/TIG domain